MSGTGDGIWTADSGDTADNPPAPDSSSGAGGDMSGTTDEVVTADSGNTVDNPVDSTFSAIQYGQAARNLLPRGRAWNREDGSNQASFCDALGVVYAQQDNACLEMLGDFFPATATEGIPEWNSSLGLPDPCAGAPASQAANQQQIVARLIASGGQSVPYFTALAAALGYEITISEFSPTVVGDDAPEGMITEASDWANTWRVNVLNDPAPSSTTILQCMFERYKPAHTQFYIVDATETPPSYRLLDVDDNVSDALLVEV